MKYKNKHIAILGAGESGTGTAELAKRMGWTVFVSDRGKIRGEYRKRLEELEIPYEEGRHSETRILEAGVVMKSPGIPGNIPLVRRIKEAGIPVISEIEFAYPYTDAVIAGITGSNGKTTTTEMLQHLLVSEGFRSVAAGNVGTSFAGSIAQAGADYYVLELSSFQLDGIVDFRPHIAVITNITPDHLDRYGNDMSRYVDSKFRIAMNQTPEDYFIYDAGDEILTRALKNHKVEARKIPFSLQRAGEEGAWVEDGNIHININKNHYTMSIESLAVQGKHNVKNTMAASLAATLLKVRRKSIRESMMQFEGIPHRLEKVLKIRGVQFINDSKATNINATYYALDSMRKPTVWIVGGVDKGNDYMELMPLVREKVKAIVCLGLDNSKIIETFANVMPVIVETKGAEEAVKVAFKLAEPGDNVLLSPACASFDLFENYIDRGNQFKEAILKL